MNPCSPRLERLRLVRTLHVLNSDRFVELARSSKLQDVTTIEYFVRQSLGALVIVHCAREEDVVRRKERQRLLQAADVNGNHRVLALALIPGFGVAGTNLQSTQELREIVFDTG